MSHTSNVKALSIKLLGGVDLTSHPEGVFEERASYMKNLIFDGGALRKRHGMHQLLSFLNTDDSPMRINGIHSYISLTGEEMIIHAGCGFYRENGERILSRVEITDTLSSVFQLGSKLYIVGCGGFYAYDGTCIDDVKPYIPLMYTGYDAPLKADRTEQRRNLLSPYARAQYSGSPAGEDASPYFRFPDNVSDSEEIRIYITISHKANNLLSQKGDSPSPDNDTPVSSHVTAEFIIPVKEYWHGYTAECEPIKYEGKTVYILDPSSTSNTVLTPSLSISKSGDSFHFNFKTDPVHPGDMNIRLEYSLKDAEESPILGCSFGEVIQDNLGQSRLVLSGNSMCPSRIFYSDGMSGMGPFYFPEDCAVYVDRDTPVTGFLKLSKTYLGVFKRDKFFRYAFYHYPEAADPMERYYINGYESRDAQGCVNPYVLGKCGADLLVFDGAGVFGIEEVSLETDKTYLSERSRNIRKALLSHKESEINSSCACMHKGKYYLFIGGKAYIADTGRTFFDRELSPHTQYEWWLYDNISARCVSNVGGKMYIGTERGGVFTEGDDYRDIEIIKEARSGDLLYDYSRGLFTLSPLIIPDDRAFIKLFGECSFLEKGEFSAFIHTSSGKTRTVILPTHPSARTVPLPRVRLIMANGGYVDCSLALFGDDEELGSFSLADEDGELICPAPDGILSIRIIDRGEREYSLRRFGNQFATYEGDEAVYWYNIYLSSPITLYRYKNVESVYVSPIFDLGDPLRRKNLYKIGIVGESGAGGSLSFGYETAESSRSFAKTDGGFDLKCLDLNCVSFQLPLGTPYARRVTERNFSSIRFFCISSEPTDCCIRRILARYSVNGSVRSRN